MDVHHHRIRPAARQHVMDSCSASPRSFDVYEKLLRWDIPLPEAARVLRAAVIPDDTSRR